MGKIMGVALAVAGVAAVLAAGPAAAGTNLNGVALNGVRLNGPAPSGLAGAESAVDPGALALRAVRLPSGERAPRAAGG